MFEYSSDMTTQETVLTNLRAWVEALSETPPGSAYVEYQINNRRVRKEAPKDFALAIREGLKLIAELEAQIEDGGFHSNLVKLKRD